MIDRQLSLADIVHGVYGRYAPGGRVKVKYSEDVVTGIRTIHTVWRELTDLYIADEAWNLSGEQKVKRLLNVERWPQLTYIGPVAPVDSVV